MRTCRSTSCDNEAEYNQPTDLCSSCWDAWWNHHLSDPDQALQAVLVGDWIRSAEDSIEIQGVVTE